MKQRILVRAVWNNVTLAESPEDETVVLEGYRYFPPHSLRQEFFKESDHTTLCKWKGVSLYKHLVVDGRILHDGAWYYPDPTPKAQEIRGLFAFWRGVQVGRV